MNNMKTLVFFSFSPPLQPNFFPLNIDNNYNDFGKPGIFHSVVKVYLFQCRLHFVHDFFII